MVPALAGPCFWRRRYWSLGSGFCGACTIPVTQALSLRCRTTVYFEHSCFLSTHEFHDVSNPQCHARSIKEAYTGRIWGKLADCGVGPDRPGYTTAWVGRTTTNPWPPLAPLTDALFLGGLTRGEHAPPNAYGARWRATRNRGKQVPGAPAATGAVAEVAAEASRSRGRPREEASSARVRGLCRCSPSGSRLHLTCAQPAD